MTTRQHTHPLRNRLARDDGASLIIALVITTVVALVVGAVLGLSGASVDATVATNTQARSSSAADAAAQVAINAVQNSTYNNDVASTTYPKCFGNTATSDSMTVPYPGGGGSTFVTCAPDPGSGAGGGLVLITNQNKPGYAILTLGTSTTEDGINVKALSSTIPFNVHGGVVSDSNIAVPNGKLVSNAAVFGHTTCVPLASIVGNPTTCPGPTAPDPNYAAELSTVPAYQAVPADALANCPGKVMTFLPGYYDNATALSALMNGAGSNKCKGSVWWFKPGNYYFDFHDSLTGGSDIWKVTDGQVLAGRPIDAAGNVLAKPTAPVTTPGGCENPIKTENAQGVQFTFGGDSQLFMKSGDAEICGTYHTDRPPLAVYGVKTGGVETRTPLSGTTAVALNTVTPTAQFTAANGATVANLSTTNNAFATWTNAAGGSPTGTMTVGGFATPTAIPAGSVLNAATATVVYKNDGGVAGDVRKLTITVGGTALPVVTLPSTSGATVQTANVDISAALATLVHDNGYSGATVQYAATVSHKNTESVDSITLNLAYTAPVLRAESGCAVTVPWTGPSGCAAISTDTSYAGRFYIQGTTYMPLAHIDLTLNNPTAQVLRFGVVARSLSIKETGSISYNGPVIEIPDNSPGLGIGSTIIYLTVYDCPGVSTCSSSGRLRLRSRVLVFDPTGTPVAGSRTMNIQSWAVQR